MKVFSLPMATVASGSNDLLAASIAGQTRTALQPTTCTADTTT